MLRPLPLVLLASALVGGCGDAPPAPGPVGSEAAVHTRRAAPAVSVRTEAGPVPLASLRGQTVVLLLAPPGHAAWTVLDEVRPDLEASGAVVLTEVVDGGPTGAAQAFGYRDAPLAVVVDGEGDVRGEGAPTSGDDLFALAAPVLAEAEVARTVSWEGAHTLGDLVAAGGMVVDLGTNGPAHALRLPLRALEATSLPADLGTPLAFTGPDAAEAASRSVAWGYVSVYVAEASGALVPVEAPRPPLPRPGRSGGVRG